MDNFQEISRSEYFNEVDIIRGKKEWEDWFYSNGQFDVIIGENILTIFIRDNTEMKYYKTSSLFIDLIHSLLGKLSMHELHLKEGFVDRSLNTEMYSRIDKFKFSIGPMFFKFEELETLKNKILLHLKKEG